MNKKLFKKTIALFLSLLIIFSAVFAVSAYDMDDDDDYDIVYREVELDKVYEFDNREYFSFVPKESGLYEFTCNYGYFESILDEKDEDPTYVTSSAFSRETREAELSANQKVFLIVRRWWGIPDFDYEFEPSVSVKFICSHSGSTREVEEETVGCNEIGYTAGTYCDSCESWVSGHKAFFNPHKDENLDRLCDICGEEAVTKKGFANEEKTAEYVLYSDGTLEVFGTGSVYIDDIYVGEAEDDNGICVSDFVKKIVVNEGITELSEEAFFKFDYVTEVKLPESLEKIDNRAFVYSQPFDEFYIPSKLKEIADGIFISIQVSNKFVVSPENEAFWADEYGVLYSKDKKAIYVAPSGLGENYAILEGTEEIKEGAFYHCKNLKSVTVPESIYIIGEEAFSEEMINSAEEIDGVRYIGSIAVGRNTEKDVETLRFRDGTRIIYPFSFYGDTGFKKVEFPESLVSICAYAFRETNIKSVSLPSKIRFIGDGAFNYMEYFVSPASVERLDYIDMNYLAVLNPECDMSHASLWWLDIYMVLGYSGSTAEDCAKKFGALFDSLDKDHEHIYFESEIIPKTCTEGGESRFFCPCGNGNEYMKETEPRGHGWYHDWDKKGNEYWYCIYCDETTDKNPHSNPDYEDCDCICHKDGIAKIFYKIIRVLWKLFRIKEECDCGAWHY